MTITTVQKLIKIGSSRGVTLPAKALRELGVKDDDELELIVRKKPARPSNDEVTRAADEIMRKYRTTFENLADR